MPSSTCLLIYRINNHNAATIEGSSTPTLVVNTDQIPASKRINQPPPNVNIVYVNSAPQGAVLAQAVPYTPNYEMNKSPREMGITIPPGTPPGATITAMSPDGQQVQVIDDLNFMGM